MTWLTTGRTFWRTLFANCASEQFVKLGVEHFARGDQFFHSGDLGIYIHPHHLVSVGMR